jgi:hypothetical protein
MGKLAACHVDRLIAIMHGERYPQVDPFFTAAVQDAIGLIGPVHGNVVPNLVDRMEAIAAGTAFHPQHNGAMGRICYLRSVAALERMGPASASATSYLKRVIGGNPFGDREKTLAMVKALGAIGPGAAEAAPELRRIADAKPPVKPDAGFDELRQAAIAALGAVSPAAGAAAGATK